MSHLSSRPLSSTSESKLEMYLEDLPMRQRPVKSPCLRLTFKVRDVSRRLAHEAKASEVALLALGLLNVL
jgi:hypothetical protein